jgi:hypothetical protein
MRTAIIDTMESTLHGQLTVCDEETGEETIHEYVYVMDEIWHSLTLTPHIMYDQDTLDEITNKILFEVGGKL